MTELADISFRALVRSDLPRLHHWMAQPHVERWWHQAFDLAELERYDGPRIDGTEPTHVFVIELAARPSGFIQWYRWRDYPGHAARLGAAPSTAGVDLAIGEVELLGQGLGSRALRAFVARVILADPAITACVADPAAENVRSLRAFERAGFVKTATFTDDENVTRSVYFFAPI
ncbi:MAG: GNAT family N-acetyltransferase [Kofleriaceae bacterium]